MRNISDKDYKTIHTICVADNFYKYANTNNYFSRDTNKGNLFNYIANRNGDNTFLGQIKGYFPIGGNHLWVQTLIINKKFIRQGYGTEIFKTTLDLLSKKSKIDKIYLTCYKDNTPGIAFWESLQFNKIENSDRNRENTCKFYIYEKIINTCN
jgi:RimJ/RimL family protein N-acetyltransferase